MSRCFTPSCFTSSLSPCHVSNTDSIILGYWHCFSTTVLQPANRHTWVLNMRYNIIILFFKYSLFSLLDSSSCLIVHLVLLRTYSSQNHSLYPYYVYLKQVKNGTSNKILVPINTQHMDITQLYGISLVLTT